MNGFNICEPPIVYPATHMLNELRSKLDEEILNHSSFESQKNIYVNIQRLEIFMKGWMWRSSRSRNFSSC
ncbi:MAG: hypothetical protein JNK79_00260 [Chitinophagaceae bacterium]|nr:hypothetical protein [Chitinophagaceae bacterium]